MKLRLATNIIQSKDGFSSEEEARKSSEVRLYKSSSPVKSKTSGDPIGLIDQSTAIDKSFVPEIEKLNAYISMGFSNGDLRNFHVLSKKATHLSGERRICYVRGEGPKLLVNEVAVNKGNSFSALYLLLKEELIGRGFSLNSDGCFEFDILNVKNLISAINVVVDKDLSEVCSLYEVVGEFDSIIINKTCSCFNQVYWLDNAYVESHPDEILAPDTNTNANTETDAVTETLKNVLSLADNISTIELKKLSVGLDNIKKYVDAKINIEELF